MSKKYKMYSIYKITSTNLAGQLPKKITKYYLMLILLGIAIHTQAQQPKVVATTSMIADITQNIGGDYVEVISLVPIGGDPHLYDPIPQDAVKIAEAQLILKNGLTLEGWLNEFIENSGTKAATLTVTDGIKPLVSSQYENAADPHAWMNALHGITYAENIKNALTQLLPNLQTELQVNFEKYKTDLEELDASIKEKIATIPEEQRILITSHDAFQYYGQHYGIRLEAVLGTSTDAEAQTSDINRLYKVIKETKVPAVFIESTVNPKLLQQIAKDTKVKIGGKLYADSLGEPGSAGDSYLKMLEYNTNVIVKALTTTDEPTIDTGENNFKNNRPIYTILIALLFVGGFWFMFKKVR